MSEAEIVELAINWHEAKRAATIMGCVEDSYDKVRQARAAQAQAEQVLRDALDAILVERARGAKR